MKAIEAYAMSKTYTDHSIAGGGISAGKNCTIDSITDIKELDKLVKDRGLEYLFGYPQIGKAGFYSAIQSAKKRLSEVTQ